MDDDAAHVVPDSPRIGLAVRESAADFFYNSWRLVPANAIWGVLFLAVSFATAIWLPALTLVVLLSVPVAGMHTMAAIIYRESPASFRDFLGGMRRYGIVALAIGACAFVFAVVLTSNVFFGLDAGGIPGWTLSAFALYGDIGLLMFLVCVWPILVDPVRADEPLRAKLRLAALVSLARPGRMLALTVVIVAILALSTVLFAALLTISVAFVSLVATRYVLPVADRVEGRRTKLAPE
ncbi:MAG: hypothetical protein ABIP53_07295 [Candidatus Limnocylindrales bacterium]